MNFHRHISTLFFLLLTSISFGQTQLLKNHDFDKGGYYLIGVRSDGDRNSLADSLGEFYTDDIGVLNAIKKEWTFTRPSPKYACGYHYEVLVCENGLELESFSINLNCNEIVSDNGYFYFETQKLRMFKDSFKKPIKKEENFTSLTDARNYMEIILKDTNLILTPTPTWIQYEGTFQFTYVCPEGSKDCLDNEEKLLKRMTKEIKLKYPGEKFEIEGTGGSSSDLFVEVKCNKTLADKFDLYKRNLESDKWEPCDLWFYTFWTVRQK